MAPFAPGTETLAKEVTKDGVRLAGTICEAVERAERAGKKRPAAPTVAKTETPSTGQRGARVRRGALPVGEHSHHRRDCPTKAKNSGKAAPDKSADQPKRDVRCATCEAENDHHTRLCPLQTCLGCGEKGHAKLDCKSKEKRKDENKPRPVLA